MSEVIEQKIAVTQKKAARLLDVSPQFLRRLTQQGRIPCRREGGLTLYSVEELKAWINGKSQQQ